MPGNAITYSIVASNAGPSTATGASVTDPLALNPTIASDTWTATRTGGATGYSASGSGTIDDSLTIPSGGSITYTVMAVLASSATGTLSNTATASASDASTVTATDTDTLNAQATLAITKTDGVSSIVAGSPDTYTIVVSNTGPCDASNLSVADTLPAQGLTNLSSPDLPAGVTFNAATDTWTPASLAPGQSVTLEIQGTVPSGATGSTYDNTATASASDASAVSATDTDSLSTQATLSITKTDDHGGSSVTHTAGTAVPGTSITYTIVATNSGPSTAFGASVTDPLASNPAIGSDSWTATGSGGTTGYSASGTGSISDSLTIPSGGSVTYTVVAALVSSASGTLSNTATASASDATTVTATDTDTLNAQATLAITKTDGTTSVVPGTTDTYTIVVSNTGPSDASNLSVADTLPAQGLTNVSSPGLPSGVTFDAGTDTWSLSSLAAGQSVTLEIQGTVPSAATGSTYVNTATASASDASAVSATDTDSLSSQATLSITKTDNHGGSSATHTAGSAVPGTSITYTIVATNSGPSTAFGASVTDPLASNPAIGSDSWTATGSGGTTGYSASGTGSISDSLTIPSGGSVTYTVVAALVSSASGTLSNTATASASDASTVTATDTDALTAQATLAITKTDGVTSVVAGSSDTYTIVVSNSGPSDASNLSVADTLPAQGLTNVSSPGLPSGVTFDAGTWTVGTLAAGQSVTLKIQGTVPSGATGSTYVNTATASATDASTVTATDTDALTAQATLSITKTDGVTSVVAGSSDTYTIVVSNSGPSDASNLSVADTLPAQGLTNVSSPSLPSGVTFDAGTDTWTLATLDSGQSVTLQLHGTVPSGATGATYVNTATASASDASAVSATDTDSLSSDATLSITKTDGVTSVVAGSSDTYTIVVSNSGPSDASNLSVADTLPAQGLTNLSSPGLPSGVTFDAGTWTVGTLAAGQSVTLKIQGTVPSGATGATYVNTATASATDASTVTATDTDALTAQATLAITKTDGVTSVVAGSSDTYTIVVSNSGPSDASNLSVADTLPAQGLTNLSSPGLPSGVTFDAGTWTVGTLAAGQSVTLKIQGTVPSGATGSTYVNTATASATDASTVTATDTDALTAQATLAITKTDGVTSVVAGSSDTYTIVVSNSGPSDASNLSVADTLPAQGLTNVSSPGLPSGVTFDAGTDTWTLATLDSGQSVTLQLHGTVPSGATGATYVNTATASASDASAVSATDTDSLSSDATLSITKTDNDGGSSATHTAGSAVPGTSITYTIVATNSGPSTAFGASVTDPLASNPAIGSDTWTATGSGGTTGFSASGTGSISDSLTIPSGGSVTYTVVAALVSSATGTLSNTATASASDASTVTATDTDTLGPRATLSITKTDNHGGSSATHTAGSAVPGTSITYTIVATNSGPSTAFGASVTDPLASNPTIGSDSWTATGSGGTTGYSASGTGSISDSLTIPSGGSVTYTVVAALVSSASGTLSNTATASASDASTVTATDTDALTAQATLAITKTDGVTSVVAGSSDTYTIVVSNSGPSDASNLSVADTLPAQGLTNVSSPGLPSGVTFDAGTWTVGTLAAGQSVTLKIQGTVPSGATGSTYVNTATASATDASTVTATDTDALTAQATLSITKTDGVTSVVAGSSDTYTIVVSNSGPSDASNLSVADTLPAQGLTNVSSPSLPSGVTFDAGTDTWTLATLDSGQSVTLQLHGTVPSGATGATYVNTATASASDASAVSATDTDSLSSDATLSITKTDNDGGSSATHTAGSAVPGTSITYTIVATNSGPSTAFGASVTDPLASNPAIGSDTWTATGSGGTTGFSASGTGSISDSLTIPSGGSVTYTVVAALVSSATGTLSNTATASASDASTVTATDTDTLGPRATLAITKTDNDGGSSATHTAGSAVPGTSITYTIVATNSGPSTAFGASVTDPLASNPAIGSDTWTATGSGGTTGYSASGTGSISDSLTIPSGGSVTYTVVAALVSSATGTLSNTATASASDASTVTATDTDSLSSEATLSITKTDGVTSVVAGSSDTYTIVVSNSGPSDASNLSVADTLPAQGLTNVSSPGLPSGATFDAGTWTVGTLAAGQSVTLEIQGTVPSGATGATYVNTATASASDASAVSATDTDSLSSQATLSITKTDDHGGSSATHTAGSAVPGTSITYTIVATNSGPSTAFGASVTDPLASNPAIGSDSWTATGSGGTTGYSASGTGSISDSLTIPSGGSVTYTVVAALVSSASGTLSNTATSSAANADTVSATDSDTLAPQATLAVTKTDGVSSVVAGSSDTYTIVLSNSGPSDASNLSVADTLPAQGLTNLSSPGLSSGVTFDAGTDTWSLSSLAAGQSVTLEIQGTVPSAATGSTYVNTATASASDASTVTATDTDSLSDHASLGITMTDGASSVAAGSSDTYTIVVSDTGPSDALNLSVVDTLPAQGLTNVSSPSLPAGVTFIPGTDTWTLSSLAAGQSITLKLQGTVPSGATGTMSNTAIAGASDASAVSATDTDTLVSQGNLAIIKTDNHGGSSATGTVGTAVPGASITYTIVASDTGPSDVNGAEVYDPVTVIHSISSDTWTATASGGATGFTPSGSGSIDDILAIPAGGSVTYTVVAAISGSASGTLSNTVTLTPPSGFTNTNPLATGGGAASATDSDALAQSHLAITNTDNVTSVGAGSPDSYTIVVTNTGPSSAFNLSVVDTLPSQGFANMSSPSLPSGVTFNAATATWSLASLAAGQSVTLVLQGTVPPGATGTSYADTATASAADASSVSATDTDTLGNQGDVTITMTDNDGGSSVTPATGAAAAGSTITYTIVAANSGPSTVTGAETYNPLSVIRAITSDSYTATGAGGATGFTPSGTGSIDDIVTIPGGGSVTYVVVATISGSATGTLSNTVTLTPPGGFTNTNPLATAGGAVSATDRDTITSS